MAGGVVSGFATLIGVMDALCSWFRDRTRSATLTGPSLGLGRGCAEIPTWLAGGSDAFLESPESEVVVATMMGSLSESF